MLNINEYLEELENEDNYDFNDGEINYLDGNIKKVAPSLDDYDGNESQQY